MGLPRPQPCKCFGGSCWREFCPVSDKNLRRAREREEVERRGDHKEPEAEET